jgi:hypothetical protein
MLGRDSEARRAKGGPDRAQLRALGFEFAARAKAGVSDETW